MDPAKKTRVLWEGQVLVLKITHTHTTQHNIITDTIIIRRTSMMCRTTSSRLLQRILLATTLCMLLLQLLPTRILATHDMEHRKLVRGGIAGAHPVAPFEYLVQFHSPDNDDNAFDFEATLNRLFLQDNEQEDEEDNEEEQQQQHQVVERYQHVFCGVALTGVSRALLTRLLQDPAVALVEEVGTCCVCVSMYMYVYV